MRHDEDITYCVNDNCKLNCARKRITYDRLVSYAEFEGGLDCSFFIPNEPEKPIKKSKR